MISIHVVYVTILLTSPAVIPPEQPLHTEDYKSDIIKNHKPKVNPAFNVQPLMGNVKLILLTCNENEKYAVYEKLQPPPDPLGSLRAPLKRALYVPQHDLVIGIFAGYTVAVLTTEQGKKADIPLKAALDLFPNAQAIIAVGVGYGKSCDSIKFADVMVSDHIENASQVSMVETNDQDIHVEQRGGRLPIKNELLRYFKCPSEWYHENGFQVSKEGRKSQAKVGTIVSCETLVRARSLQEEYMALMAKAVGGEMEGCSLLNMIEWMEQVRRPLSVMVIKGVADYGDNQRDKRWQLTAAKAAVDFVHYCLEQTGGMGQFLPVSCIIIHKTCTSLVLSYEL